MAQINYRLAEGSEANIDSKLISRMLGLGTDTKRMSVKDNLGVSYRFPSEARIADVSVNFAYNIGYNGIVSGSTVGEALDSLSSAIGLSNGSGLAFVDLGTHNFVAGQHNAFKIGTADIAEGQASLLEIVISDDDLLIQAIGHVMLGSNTAGATQSYLLDWSFNNIAYQYAVGDWELYTDTSSPSSFGFGIKTGINFNNHSVKMATIGAQSIGIDTIDINVATSSPTFIELFDISNNTGGGGSPSQGVQGLLNIADGAGGWLAMDGSARPLLEWSSTTGNLVFSGGNFLISETIQATSKFDVVDASGEIRFRNSADTSTLARFQISENNIGVGLHELYLYDCKRLTIPNDLKVAGDVTFDNLVDPATDTGKKMVVIDTTTKEIEERPIPSGGGSSSQGAQYDFNFADGAGGWTSLDGTSFPRLYLDNTTNIINYQSAIEASGFTANLSYDLHYDTGKVTFKDTTGATDLAEIRVDKDALGVGLHELKVFYAKQFTVNNDLGVNGQIIVPSLIDSGTDTGKKMLVIDTTSKQIEERPIPTGVGGSDTKVLVQGQMNTTQSFTSTAERIDYVDSTLDVNNEWDNTTHRFTCGASGAGVYQFTNTLFVDNSNGWVQIFCKKNGVTQRITATDLHSSWDAPAGTTNIELVVGDYVEFWADSTTSFSVNATWYALNNFQITKISAVAPTAGVDVNAVHTNIANEITPLTAKAIASVDDVVLIEDSADSNNKKKISVGALRSGVESFTNPSSLSTDASLITQTNANAQAQALTINLPTNAFDGAKIIYRIKATATSTLTWNVGFNDLKGALPTSAPINKSIYVGVIYDDYSSTWDVVSVVEQS